MKQKFINLITKYMKPWTPAAGGFMAKLTNKELKDFADGVIPPEKIVKEDGEFDLIYLCTEDIVDAMEELKYEMAVVYNPFEGLISGWVVELMPGVKISN